MKNSLLMLASILSANEKQRFYKLSIAVVIVALIETAGVASVMPFVGIVANPEIIQSNHIVNTIYTSFGFVKTESFLIASGVAVLMIILLSNAVSAVATYLLLRYSFAVGSSLSTRLLTEYISRPYLFFLQRNSAELINNVFTETSKIVHGIVVPLTVVTAKSVSALFIVLLLMYVEPGLSLFVMMIFLVAYVLIYSAARKTLSQVGKESVGIAGKRFKTVNESMNGIKEIKISGSESLFIDDYRMLSDKLARFQATSQAIGQLPKFGLEVIAFGSVVLLILFLIFNNREFSDIIPIVTLYAFSGYRLMPAFQNVFSSVSKIKYNTPSLETIFNDLNSQHYERNDKARKTDAVIEFKDEIRFTDVAFRYPDADVDAVKTLNLTVKKNTTIGITGKTGSGKSTFVDLLLGLQMPCQGKITIDDLALSQANSREWQKHIGYVPQSIYLIDDTIEKNVAFGVDPQHINHSQVIHACKLANIHDFIENDLLSKYQTVIGENGVRLSGGQKQRIGIARALYHNPDVVIFDEATSALDDETESAIISAINELSHKKTIFMIAHRLNTIKQCDSILVFDKGELVCSDSYMKLAEECVQFGSLLATKY